MGTIALQPEKYTPKHDSVSLKWFSLLTHKGGRSGLRSWCNTIFLATGLRGFSHEVNVRTGIVSHLQERLLALQGPSSCLGCLLKRNPE
jgi:hypothetical protein